MLRKAPPQSIVHFLLGLALLIFIGSFGHAGIILHYSFDNAADLAANSAGLDGTINEGPLNAAAGMFGGAAHFTPNPAGLNNQLERTRKTRATSG